MARFYYYFLSSLPYLTFGHKPPMTLEAYLLLCQEQFVEGDAAAVFSAVREEAPVSFGAAQAWRVLRHALRNELAAERAIRAGKDPALYVRGERTADASLRHVVHEVVTAQDPLGAQMFLDRWLWARLSDIEAGHYFDVDNAIVYGLRLQILQRYEDSMSSRGSEIFADYLKDERLSAVYAAVGKK